MDQTFCDLLSIINACRTPQDYADHSIELIGNPIFVMDVNMRVIAITDCEVEDEVYRSMKDTRHPPAALTGDRTWRSHMKRFLAEEQVSNTFAFGNNHLHKVLRMGGSVIGQIEAIDYLRPFTDTDKEVLELMSHACAICIFNQMALQAPHGSRVDYSLEYLLDGNRISEEQIRIQCAMRDWYPGKTLYCGVIDTFGSGKSDEELSLGEVLEPGDKEIHYKNYRVFILNRSRGMKEDGAQWLEQALEGLGVVCGLSYPFSMLSELKQYFDQACAALEIGQRVDGQRHLYHISDYQEYRIILECAKSTDVLRFVMPQLIDLAEYDRNRKLGILKTLRMYFTLDRSVQAVADQLHVHRNTINYRIARGTERMGIDLSDGRAAAQLLESLHILEFVNKDKYFS